MLASCTSQTSVWTQSDNGRLSQTRINMVRGTTLAQGLAAVLFLASALARTVDEAESTLAANIAGSLTVSVCEARTINYITHALPQSCLTSSWKSPSPTSTTPTVSTHPEDGDTERHGHETLVPPTLTSGQLRNTSEVQVTEPAATTFMSFEDWKEMMLRRAGQDPQDLQSRKPSEHDTGDRYSQESGYAGLGEEGEISLNFEHYSDKGNQGATPPSSIHGDGVGKKTVGDAQLHDEGKSATVHLSKDAGKTCKERFSYSSFDAGATILKTSPGAKNARAILVENKDTYMLLECDASAKYVIVELSDDISVDTVVLANFEFFSSMVRHFRVSVSDRYPVKMDKWRELGTFEARNSRDIQPFLIENPQIWAKYVRIEFLTHFGNEYYCPISLLRIHGSRMLDSWKDSEGGREEDTLIEGYETGRTDSSVQDEYHSFNVVDSRAINGNLTLFNDTSPWNWLVAMAAFSNLNTTCPALPHVPDNTSNYESTMLPIGPGASKIQDTTSSEVAHVRPASREKGAKSPGHAEPTQATSTVNYPSPISISQDNPLNTSQGALDKTISKDNSTMADRQNNATTATTSTTYKIPTPSGQNGKPRSSGTSGASAASPTMQESFFNAITKRLHHVESNLTLSMKYVEDQSKHVQEALQSREQKQQAKIAVFLDELNKTVLSELRNVREQYDQIWQSTVLALESQKDRSERDMMALSSRLNLLADEVVFQKRMAIVQAIILLSCLFLIIFSRGVSLPSLAPLLDQPPDSACDTPASPATPRQHSYQSKKKHHKGDVSLFSPSNAVDQAQLIRPDAVPNDKAAMPSSFEAIPFHSQGEPSTRSYTFQRFSPPPTPNPLEEASLSDDANSSTGADHMPPRRVGGTTHINHRKPLPSLPEHPRSDDG